MSEPLTSQWAFVSLAYKPKKKKKKRWRLERLSLGFNVKGSFESEKSESLRAKRPKGCLGQGAFRIDVL